ncbi:hypothetical protein SAMN02745823_01247 [Sporobacter termitidis DSM 10068]|uniref:Uncharacterized protein n=2 Tax=Sporobacter TaxID=44748 RepID=A0A1M5WGK8_9FIRM|nr:hypothetical protein SAMN02745823_01247 [Sporobacter termitidis DSM 10068]
MTPEASAPSPTPDAAPLPPGAFAVSSGNIHDYLPDLIVGKPVSAYALLPCLDSFSRGTWSELETAYGGPDGTDWWSPLLTALNDSAAGDDQEMRDYYLGRAYLTSDGAYSEGLDGPLLAQWEADSTAYNACLSGRFSADEATALRQALTFAVGSDGNAYGLYLPGAARAIYLDKYPIDFPFGFELRENSRSSFRAESFGPGGVVESDGLQVTYLTPEDGVFSVTTIRTVKEGCGIWGVAVGQPERVLLNSSIPLKKIDSLSYDDAAWFGKCDRVYAFLPEESTIAVVFAVKDDVVYGIELINGLDGQMY